VKDPKIIERAWRTVKGVLLMVIAVKRLLARKSLIGNLQ